MKKGLTIVELIVVMSLMAVIFALSVSGLIALGNTGIVDKTKESYLTLIRDSQNRSMAVTPNEKTGELPIVWGVYLKSDPTNSQNNRMELINIVDDAGTFKFNSVDNTKDSELKRLDNVSIKVTDPNNGNNVVANPNDLYLYYAAPFGRYYVSSRQCIVLSDNCSWIGTSVRPKDYKVNKDHNTGSGFIFDTYDIEITFKFKNSESKIKIQASGEANEG